METKEEIIKKWREEGRSEHEITYYLADKQKDYEPLLKDPDTPENIITDIADEITILHLKILVLKHPNVSERSQRYIIDKADKKDYLKEIVESFLSNEKDLNGANWVKLRKLYNKAQRFDICVLELLEEQSNVFTLQKLNTIFNSLQMMNKYQSRYVELIVNHKNFNVTILDGALLTQIQPSRFYNTFEKSKHKEDIFNKLFDMSNDDMWLSEEAKDIFLF